jgi:hypothetical protein
MAGAKELAMRAADKIGGPNPQWQSQPSLSGQYNLAVTCRGVAVRASKVCSGQNCGLLRRSKQLTYGNPQHGRFRAPASGGAGRETVSSDGTIGHHLVELSSSNLKRIP